MLSLHQVINLLETHKNSSNDEACLNVIRNGIKINPNFWNDFIRICNNIDSLSELLGVPKDQIANWPSIINDYLKMINDKDSGYSNKKNRVLKTGVS